MAALACLYGVVRKRQVVKIYNEQNQDQISLDDVEAIVQESSEINNYTHVIQEYIVRDYTNDVHDVEELLERQGGKISYIPQKEELLKYINPDYFEITPEYTKLLDLINKYTSDDELIEELSSDIIYSVITGYDMNDIIQSFLNAIPEVDSETKLKKVVDVIVNLINNTRTPENKGNPQTNYPRKDRFTHRKSSNYRGFLLSRINLNK